MLIAIIALLSVPSLSNGQTPDSPEGYGEGYSSGYPAEEMNMEEPDDGEEGYGPGYFSGMEGMDGAPGASGGSAPRPRMSRGGGGGQNAMIQPYSSAMSSLMGSIDFGPLLAPPSAVAPVDTGPALQADAENAYRNGNYPLGLELYFGHMVTEYDQAMVDLQKVKYSQLLRRPVWQIRWGVSYAVRGSTEVEDAQPIEEGKTPVNRNAGGRSRGPNPGYGGEEMQMEMQMEEEDDMDGQMEMEMAMPGYGGEGAPGGRSRTRQAPARQQREMLSAEAQATMDRYLGLVGKIVAEEFDRRYRQGDFGLALATVTPPVQVETRNGQRQPANDEPQISFAPASQAVSDALDDSPEPRPLWKPGLMFYGEGDSKDIAKIAKRDGIDMLLHFDIYLKSVKTTRNEYVQNVSRCRLLRVADAKSLGVSKSMDNVEAITQARTGRASEREYVMAQMESLLALIDRYVVTTDLPKLSPAVAKKQVGRLLSGPRAKSLRTLAEIRLYQVQQLLTEQEVEAAFDIIGGEEALLLLHGPTEKRLETARKWAVQAVPAFDE